jgi:outer membrane receptor protein involved in Fe transport
MKNLPVFLFLIGFYTLSAQHASVSGLLKNADGEAITFANIGLFSMVDSVFIKAGYSDDQGSFDVTGLKTGDYFLKATLLGYKEQKVDGIKVVDNQRFELGTITMMPESVTLEEATIVASRVMVEVKPDRTIFNVEGTLNSVGSDALSLLRKAPGVTVDNNDNINVLGRAGVILYIDGKRLPLSGQDLSNYLQNLTAEQIDRFEIITNPGAKYEAEGNAGIIDIRLKRDKNLGTNGSLNSTVSNGRYHRANLSGTGNYRNKKLNVFGNGSLGDGKGYNDMAFFSFLNNMVQEEINNSVNDFQNYNYRVGTDFFLSKNQTIGFLASGGAVVRENTGYNRITLAQEATPTQLDSILIANSNATSTRRQQTYNLNYQFNNNQGRSFNLDLDYGNYNNESKRYQPNQYYDATEEVLLSEFNFAFNTPSNIDIYTLQADYEDNFLGGKISFGSKFSKVVSDNTFLVFDNSELPENLDKRLSNAFEYDENVLAGYFSYARPFGDKWNFSAGLRAEKTDAIGTLEAFLPELQEPPLKLDYLSWFPNLGLTWQMKPDQVFQLSAGRRINRPDYNVLNPFNNYLSQLSYEKGNPFLKPEIVNNIELGYTLAYRYNFKLAYSLTTDQITRLIAPDENDPRAGFITWDNLAKQTIIGFNASAPVQITKKWNAYFNLSASHLDNQADYGEGAIVDVQAFTYSIYQQHTFDLPLGIQGEISGYFSGPGVWGGVFVYETSWSLDVGLQRKFFKNKLNVRLSGSDLFYESGWDGYSDFDGLYSFGSGRYDSRRATISIGYNFGNQNVKSRRRETSIEAEAGRVKD